MRYYGFNPVISINKFDSDTEAEIDLLKEHCNLQNVAVALNEGWLKGGEGATGLANLVVNAVNGSPDGLQLLYDLEWSFEKKIETIATKMYGADHVEYKLRRKNIGS